MSSKKETKMFEFIKSIFKRIKPTTYGSALEAYIVSKNPTSTAEVEHWARQYDQLVTKGAL